MNNKRHQTQVRTGSYPAWIQDSIKYYIWLPTCLFVFHMVTSELFGLYDAYPSADVPMHFLGGFCISYFLRGVYLEGVKHRLFGQPSKLMYFFFVFAWASASTIFWEFAEFSGDVILGTNMQDGLADTMIDMFLGMAGAVVFLLGAELFGKPIKE
jgi:hypothetical protein